MNRILVIGGTGNIGRPLISQLITTGAPIRTLVRNPELAGFPPAVETMQGDLTCPETLDASLAGIHTVFLVWTAPADAAPAAIAQIANHARRIVFLSAPLNRRELSRNG